MGPLCCVPRHAVRSPSMRGRGQLQRGPPTDRGLQPAGRGGGEQRDGRTGGQDAATAERGAGGHKGWATAAAAAFRAGVALNPFNLPPPSPRVASQRPQQDARVDVVL